MKPKQQKFRNRKRRVYSKIRGTSEKPRLSVFRSNKYIYAQIIDDQKCRTMVHASESEIKVGKRKMTKTDKAHVVGELIAKKAKAKKIATVVFDRSGYRYHGRVKALADGARKGGLKF